MNTFMIAVCTCIVSTFFVLSVAYCLSRVKWTMRKPYMNMAMVINLFPGFMSMIEIYFLLKAMGLTEGSGIPIALVICFSAGAAAAMLCSLISPFYLASPMGVLVVHSYNGVKSTHSHKYNYLLYPVLLVIGWAFGILL